MKRNYNFYKSLVKDSYESLKDYLPYSEALERALINVLEPIDINNVDHPTIVFNSKDELKDLIVAELQYEVNINANVEAGDYYTLTDETGHIAWYREKTASNQIKFNFWDRYKKYLLNIKGWGEPTIKKLDEVTDEIIEKIEDPTIKNRPFDRRGLVVGYVQSGKTANFMGVINKAIDCGYRIIIVLSGMHNNLRSQTQMRIDEEVIGRDTSEIAQVKRIGVTTLPNENYIKVDTFTTQDDKGDFNRAFAQQVGGVQPGNTPMLFIVKKNASVLRNLIRYFRDCVELLDNESTIKTEENEVILNNFPLLLIDDEADQASPNTRRPTNSDGDELDPTAINYCIREILNLFNQKAYVGYTATPFANIFIHHDIEHSELGRDLFPSSFIISLDAPTNYFGPIEVFGLNEDENENGLPIFIPVVDAAQTNSEFLPLKHKVDAIPTQIPDSMKEALKSFVISSAIRRIRGQNRKHNTMLIHSTRYNDIQNAIGNFVSDEFNRIREGIINKDEEIINSIKILWERDYNRISVEMNMTTHPWEQIQENLEPAIIKMERRPHVINGSAGDILDYKNREGEGLSVIVIGGDKLSRGLTLHGLTVSYFTRTSSLYDTLMQMGRWFGYRNEYEDLCRIYTTPDLFSWYRHISTAFEILKNEFLEMSRQKLTPIEFGLRVLSHPEMMATNAMKMRHSTTMPLTYKGKFTETSSLSNDKTVIINNYNATEEFIKSLGKPHPEPNDIYLWKDINKSIIISFFEKYISYKGAPSSKTERIIEFINEQKDNSVLDLWNVSLMTLKRNKGDLKILGGLEIKPLNRSLKEDSSEKLFIKRLAGSQDEKIDFDSQPTETAESLRRLSPRINRPLLIIYPLEIEDFQSSNILSFDKMPIGFAISWPNNDELRETTYDINTVYRRELELDRYDD